MKERKRSPLSQEEALEKADIVNCITVLWQKEALVYKEELLTLTYIIKMPPEGLGRREERKVEAGVSSPKWPRKGLDS